jgi:hypothetical protein
LLRAFRCEVWRRVTLMMSRLTLLCVTWAESLNLATLFYLFMVEPFSPFWVRFLSYIFKIKYYYSLTHCSVHWHLVCFKHIAGNRPYARHIWYKFS